MSNMGNELLKSLRQNSNIIFKQADKGGGLIIQNKEAYISEAKLLLGDVYTYERLSSDPRLQYKEVLKTRALTLKVLSINPAH